MRRKRNDANRVVTRATRVCTYHGSPLHVQDRSRYSPEHLSWRSEQVCLQRSHNLLQRHFKVRSNDQGTAWNWDSTTNATDSLRHSPKCVPTLGCASVGLEVRAEWWLLAVDGCHHPRLWPAQWLEDVADAKFVVCKGLPNVCSCGHKSTCENHHLPMPRNKTNSEQDTKRSLKPLYQLPHPSRPYRLFLIETRIFSLLVATEFQRDENSGKSTIDLWRAKEFKWIQVHARKMKPHKKTYNGSMPCP